MSYAQIIDAALQLFPKKIRVTCIDGVTGKKIGKYKVGLDQLPAAFTKPVTLTIEGNEWRVIQAKPISVNDFSIFKKLTLHVLNIEQLQQAPLGNNVPTQHASEPLTGTPPLYHDFTLEIASDDWLQLEFLPAAAIAPIQEELAIIDKILQAENGHNPLLGYKTFHIRTQTAHLGAHIPFDAFCAELPIQKMGNLRLANNNFVANGFAIQTDNHTYYGTVTDGLITHLCLPAFDFIDDEFSLVTTTWELALVDWCNANVIM